MKYTKAGNLFYVFTVRLFFAQLNERNMISYNPKEWITGIVMVGKADTLRKLTVPILLVSLYSLIIVIIDLHVLNMVEQDKASKISVMHSLLGFVISLLLVFRTNTAYERWWEGRKHWGALVNCSRNMSIRIGSLLNDNSEELEHFKKLIINFPFALKNHLRNVSSMGESELDERFHIKELKSHKHVPQYISNQFYERLVTLNRSGKINTEQFISITYDWQQWMEICGACERIRNTPIPFSYSVFIKKFLFVYIFTLPIAYAPMLGYYTIPIIAFVFYVLTSLELIAEEIENPFGTDANDLPLDEISKNIRSSVDTILKEH